LQISREPIARTLTPKPKLADEESTVGGDEEDDAEEASEQGEEEEEEEEAEEECVEESEASPAAELRVSPQPMSPSTTEPSPEERVAVGGGPTEPPSVLAPEVVIASAGPGAGASVQAQMEAPRPPVTEDEPVAAATGGEGTTSDGADRTSTPPSSAEGEAREMILPIGGAPGAEGSAIVDGPVDKPSSVAAPAVEARAATPEAGADGKGRPDEEEPEPPMAATGEGVPGSQREHPSPSASADGAETVASLLVTGPDSLASDSAGPSSIALQQLLQESALREAVVIREAHTEPASPAMAEQEPLAAAPDAGEHPSPAAPEVEMGGVEGSTPLAVEALPSAGPLASPVSQVGGPVPQAERAGPAAVEEGPVAEGGEGVPSPQGVAWGGLEMVDSEGEGEGENGFGAEGDNEARSRSPRRNNPARPRQLKKQLKRSLSATRAGTKHKGHTLSLSRSSSFFFNPEAAPTPRRRRTPVAKSHGLAADAYPHELDMLFLTARDFLEGVNLQLGGEEPTERAAAATAATLYLGKDRPGETDAMYQQLLVKIAESAESARKSGVTPGRRNSHYV
jgi:hypothetical protein